MARVMDVMVGCVFVSLLYVLDVMIGCGDARRSVLDVMIGCACFSLRWHEVVQLGEHEGTLSVRLPAAR